MQARFGDKTTQTLSNASPICECRPQRALTQSDFSSSIIHPELVASSTAKSSQFLTCCRVLLFAVVFHIGIMYSTYKPTIVQSAGSSIRSRDRTLRIKIIEKKTEKTWYTARATESIRRGEGGLLSIYQVQSGDEAIHLYPVTPRPAGILFRPNRWTKHQYSSTPYIYTGLPQSHAAI